MRVIRTQRMRIWEAGFENEQGLPLLLLMEQAAYVLADRIAEEAARNPTWPIAVFCGWGNNGGDGYALARHLVLRHHCSSVRIYEYEPDHPRSDQAEQQRQACRSLQIEMLPIAAFSGGEVVGVDAVFGTGLQVREGAEPSNAWLELQEVWQRACPASSWFSVDLPSGLCGDTGREVFPCHQMAAHCLALGAAKPVHFLPHSQRWIRSVSILPLTLPELPEDSNLEIAVWEPEEDLGTWAEVDPSIHKGQRGDAVLLGGSEEQLGASLLALQAAFASGAGRVYAWLPRLAVSPALQLCPHALVGERPVIAQSELHAATLRYLKDFAGSSARSAVLLGPGLYQDTRGHEILRAALRSKVRLILDASAIRLLAMNPQTYLPLLRERARVEGGRYRCLITPHVGEYQSLRSATPESVHSADWFQELMQMAEHWHVSILYKSHISYFVRPAAVPSITDAKDSKEEGNWKLSIFPYGGPALARAGSGDILAGYILGRLVQTENWDQSVSWSVYLCGAAAELREREQGIEGWSVQDQLRSMQEVWHAYRRSRE